MPGWLERLAHIGRRRSDTARAAPCNDESKLTSLLRQAWEKWEKRCFHKRTTLKPRRTPAAAFARSPSAWVHAQCQRPSLEFAERRASACANSHVCLGDPAPTKAASSPSGGSISPQSALGRKTGPVERFTAFVLNLSPALPSLFRHTHKQTIQYLSRATPA